MLRQSIIHVEQGDINFDEDESKNSQGGAGDGGGNSQDIKMSGADMDTTDPSFDESVPVTNADACRIECHSIFNAPLLIPRNFSYADLQKHLLRNGGDLDHQTRKELSNVFVDQLYPSEFNDFIGLHTSLYRFNKTIY